MDLQPSGNKEIVFVETEDIYFILKGNNDSVGICEEASLEVISKDAILSAEYNRNMHLKEYKNYEVIIEAKKDAKIEFYHENSTIRDKVSATGRSNKMLTGVINFRGDIGYSDLYVFVNGKEHLKITVEVFPSKIDYKEDYKALIEDVNKEIYNLAYGFLGRTYLGTEIDKINKGSETEFYSILNYVYEKLLKAIDIVLYSPHHQLVKEYNIKKHHALRNTSNETIKWLEKRPQLVKNINGKYLPTEALQVNKTVTLNTNENKFLKFILVKITQKIDGFISNYNKAYWKMEEEAINVLVKMKREINRRINTSFLKDVDSNINSTSASLVFTMASGYREIYKYYLMLQKGLKIDSNLFALSMKDLPLLYEYWCFIKINALMQKRYKLLSSDMLKINNDGIVIALKKGQASTLVYEDLKTKRRFKVIYNPTYVTKTVNQKPDNVISFIDENDDKEYMFIFDAKYKIDTTQDYINKYKGVGPKEEDINTMHRYRDAIVRENKESGEYERVVLGAFVLFPYKYEEKFKEHDFSKSCEEMGIGAIPFLPSINLFENFLEDTISNNIG